MNQLLTCPKCKKKTPALGKRKGRFMCLKCYLKEDVKEYGRATNLKRHQKLINEPQAHHNIKQV
jgi:hypothetical protein